MRDYKFRVIIHNKVFGYEWIEDGMWFHNVPDLDPVNDIRKVSGTLRARGKREQFIGLKDKNEKEIYGGDIVRDVGSYKGNPPIKDVPRVVEFRNGCWCYDAGRYDDGDWIRFGYWTSSNDGKNELKQLEVIGDIHSNPELLETS